SPRFPQANFQLRVGNRVRTCTLFWDHQRSARSRISSPYRTVFELFGESAERTLFGSSYWNASCGVRVLFDGVRANRTVSNLKSPSQRGERSRAAEERARASFGDVATRHDIQVLKNIAEHA